jgi:glutamate racemase
VSNNQPVGVFDSGIGGLSVVRHILARLPAEDVLYLADSAFAPYGTRPVHYVRERVLRIGDHLAARGCKAVVVACNTATAIAVEDLRARLALPVVAMEPAIKPAARQTRSDVIGVLATPGTLNGARYAALRDLHGAEVRVLERSCHDWVALVEAGDLESEAARDVVAAELRSLLAAGADTLVLGCTHFPFLRPLIEAIAGPDVQIIDPSPAVAEQLARRLTELGQLRTDSRGRLRLSSTAPDRIHAAAVRSILAEDAVWERVEP